MIQEVEREISFRTEQGLYYSYFKQVWKKLWRKYFEFFFSPVGECSKSLWGPSSAPSGQQNWISQHNQHSTPVGFLTINFTHFFLSEFEIVWNEIIFVQIRKQFRPLHRFNVHQEVVLAALYKIYSFRLNPIFFYTYAVFALQVIIIIMGFIMFLQVFKIL